MAYSNKQEWNNAKNFDWQSKRPAPQKLTKQLSQKGAKVYSVSVSKDDHDRIKATLNTWTVTSLRKNKKATYSFIAKKIRDVVLFIVQDGTQGTWKEQVRCSGEEGLEILEEDYFSTPSQALTFAVKKNKHDLKWVNTRPPSTPDNAFLDEMFSKENYERQGLALERLKKRLKT